MLAVCLDVDEHLQFKFKLFLCHCVTPLIVVAAVVLHFQTVFPTIISSLMVQWATLVKLALGIYCRDGNKEADI